MDFYCLETARLASARLSVSTRLQPFVNADHFDGHHEDLDEDPPRNHHMENNMTLASRDITPVQLESVWGRWATGLVEAGYAPTLVTVMFNMIEGPAAERARTMDREVEKLYARLATRFVRNPRTSYGLTRMPIWLVSPDRPVPKRALDRDYLRDIAVNDGEHRHALAFIHPDSRTSAPLWAVINEHHDRFVGPERLVHRIHAVGIENDLEYVVAYALKANWRRRAGVGDMYLLPRSMSEL